MTQANKNKAELEKFLQYIQFYQAILAALNKFQQDKNPTVTTMQNLKKGLKHRVKNNYDLTKEETCILLEQIDNLNDMRRFNNNAAIKLKESLHNILQTKSVDHQDYIAGRVTRAEDKANKAIRAMPNKSTRNLLRGLGISYSISVGSAITGISLFVCGATAVAGWAYVVSLLSLTTLPFLPLYIAAGVAIAGLALAAVAAVLELVTWGIGNSLEKEYLKKCEGPQKTINNAIKYEDTYNFLKEQKIIKENLSTAQPSDDNVNLLTKTSKPLFSIKETLKKRTVPLLNEIQETRPRFKTTI